ncbi:MAG: helix-turn-helix transcriptional regulator [Fimbriimonadaceae bacterium]|nr:MAG: helix-turn-helix transcriptional regulator [Fimbriimonadaceae bacterium]
MKSDQHKEGQQLVELKEVSSRSTSPDLPTINQMVGQPTTPTYVNSLQVQKGHQIFHSIQGCAFVFSGKEKPILVGPQSTLFVPSGSDTQIAFGRGEQKWIIGHWEKTALVIAHTIVNPNLTAPQAAWHPPQECRIFRAFTNSLLGMLESGELDPRLTSAWLNLATFGLNQGRETFAFCNIPDGVTKPINELLLSIKAEPQRGWSLTEAARLAGYSPFHLSRVFRAATEIGFPEFVDRCRTEIALKQLLESKQTINEIAEHCGFGSSQAMRTACREYTGFLPSELRQGSGE